MDALVEKHALPEGEVTGHPHRPSRKEAEAAVRTLIQWSGDDPDREGLRDTPKRVTKAWRELFKGYDQNVADELDTVFEEVGGYGDIVMVRDIPFYSHCEHHIVPILGKAHIAYYPRDGVVGLSKLARVVEIFARRLQTQENLTAAVVNAIDEQLKPRGVALLMEAEHMCMAMRGIQKQGVSTITTGYTGLFREDQSEQTRFLSLIRGLR